jgi:hypothetical protein
MTVTASYTRNRIVPSIDQPGVVRHLALRPLARNDYVAVSERVVVARGRHRSEVRALRLRATQEGLLTRDYNQRVPWGGGRLFVSILGRWVATWVAAGVTSSSLRDS